MSLYYTKLVKGGLVLMSRLVELCVQNPAKALGQECGVIEVGTKAQMMLFDPNAKVVMDEKLSLYNSEELYGEIKKIFA